jgi:hypothetical protein
MDVIYEDEWVLIDISASTQNIEAFDGIVAVK